MNKLSCASHVKLLQEKGHNDAQNGFQLPDRIIDNRIILFDRKTKMLYKLLRYIYIYIYIYMDPYLTAPDAWTRCPIIIVASYMFFSPTLLYDLKAYKSSEAWKYVM